MRPNPRNLRTKATALLMVFNLIVPCAAVLRATGKIAGTVTDTAGGAVKQADVVAVNRVNGNDYSTKTGDDGKYEFSALDVGNYDLTVTTEKLFSSGEKKDVPVSAGQTTTQDFVLEPATSALLTGVVKNISGEAVEGATVVARDVETKDSFDTATNKEGRFRLRLAFSTYGVSVKKGNFVAPERRVVIRPGAVQQLNFTLRPQSDGRRDGGGARPQSSPDPDNKGKPVVITFGQPNIWSLDQAHYLLSQLRERSLDFSATRLADLDPNEAHGTRLNFTRQLFELMTEFRQPITSGSPAPSPTQPAFPSGTPERVASTDVLDGSVLSTLLANPEFQRRLFTDPKLNAVTKLDNHIQLQYEIIARQLTLLRDEVRPGERLIFLELPQAIYTTDDEADNKLAQVWWQVDGYNLYDPVKELETGIALADDRVNRFKSLARSVSEASCEPEVIKQLCAAGGEPCSKRRSDCSKLRELAYWEKSRLELAKRKEEQADDLARRTVERLLQGGPADLPEEMTVEADKYKAVRATAPTQNDFHHTKVRTVDIIPHQSSLNVNDVQETVKSSFIAASFSFLFGLGARTNFQRQRDQFEQFLHQDLYASGFGKGDSLFGWTFGPIPGTKRVAPGLRTTFAALVVPTKAESVILRARGCFFHREDNEPPDAMNQGEDSKWWNNNDRECGAVKQYLLPIPSGGGTRNFWVTGVEYVPFKLPGERMVALIKGENFTTQVGVLINGVPLKHVVELTRKLPASMRNDANANCTGICGEYEVIGPNDVNIAFEMPDNFVGTPEITIVGPGRSVVLNHLPLTVRAYGQGTYFELEDGKTPFMFGEGPQVRIGDLRLFRDLNNFVLGVLRGANLTSGATIFINGRPLISTTDINVLSDGQNRAYFDAVKKMFLLRFANPADEKLDVMIVDGSRADTRSVANPFAEAKKPAPLTVSDDNVLAYDAVQGEIAVRLSGTGLAKARLQVLSGASAESEITSQSATELIVRLVQPRVAIRIKLTNPETGEEVTRAIIRRAPPRSITEKRDVTDANRN